MARVELANRDEARLDAPQIEEEPLEQIELDIEEAAVDELEQGLARLVRVVEAREVVEVARHRALVVAEGEVEPVAAEGALGLVKDLWLGGAVVVVVVVLGRDGLLSNWQLKTN